MRVVPTGKSPHELGEVLDVTHCTGCGEPFEVGRFTKSWVQCMCAGPEHGGHRIVICRRDGCRAKTFDPPCTGQHGPTADYGGITTHPKL